MVTVPDRVQRRRAADWRTPPNTRYCGRRGPLGNPLTVRSCIETEFARAAPSARRVCAEGFRFWLLDACTDFMPRDRREEYLRLLPDLFCYDHLSCWCPLDEPCHVDSIRVGLTALAGIRPATTVDAFNPLRPRPPGLALPDWAGDWLLSAAADRFVGDVQLATTR